MSGAAEPHGSARSGRADPPRGEPEITVSLTEASLDPAAAVSAVSHPECGGIGLFAGAVRNHHRGDAVEHLVYEAWEQQVRPALREVAGQVLEAHPGVRAVYLAHRTGRLEIGELSVVVAASAPHRREAIAAAGALIDRLKETVPIWKQEHLADGGTRWPEDQDRRA